MELFRVSATRYHINTWVLSTSILILTYLTNCCWTAVTRTPLVSEQDYNERQFLTSLSIQGIHWGNYGPWSLCSKSCGTGLEYRERFCLNYLNHQVENRHCNGTTKEYRVCRIKHCRDPNEANYRLQQCSQFEYDGLRWKPHIGNAEFPVDPCSLTCFAVENHRRVELLSDTVPSGTQCMGLEGTMQYQGVCLDGECLVVGCDRFLNSSKTNDRCGVCGGDGTTCQTVSGTFIRENLQVGYTYTNVLEIPAGAKNVRVYELEQSKNYLAVSDSEGTYYLNGDLNINQPGRYRIAGAMFRYQRRMVWNMGQWREEPEILTAQGPTDRVLVIMVLKAESTAHIVYEYTVPVEVTHNALHMMAANQDTYIEEIYTNDRTEGDEILQNTVTMDTEELEEETQSVTEHGVTVVTAVEEDIYIDLSNSSNVGEFGSDNSTLTNTNSSSLNELNEGNQTTVGSTLEPNEEEEEAELEQFWQFPSKTYHTNMLPTYDSSTEPSVQFEHEEESLEPSATSQNQEEVLLNAKEEPPNWHHHNHHLHHHNEDISAKHMRTDGTLKPTLAASEERASSSSSNTMVTPKGSLYHHPTEDLPRSELALSGGITHERPLLEDYTVAIPYINADESIDEQRAAAEPNIWDNVAETTDGPLPSESDVSSASDYDTIPPGVPPHHRPPPRRVEIEVVDSIEPQHTYMWRTSGVAPCSSTCRRGVMSEFAYCERDDGIQADDFKCDSATKPEVLPRQCAGRRCEPRWEVGDWSQCTKSCGSGTRYRTVHCWRMLAPGLDSSVTSDLCNVTDIPDSTETCADDPCGPQWQTSDWSECSKSCGNGNLTREVTCSSSRAHCNPDDKPKSFKPCNAGACPTWVAGPWSKCPGQCKIQRREIQCRSRDNVLLPHSSCPADRPELTAQLCGTRCPPQWVPQKFDSCNGTCQNSFRVRKVLCSELINTHMWRTYPDSVCHRRPKPPTREACHLPHCAGNAPQRTQRHHTQPKAKWLTTDWSKCSRTCGTGVKTRSVRCYLNGILDNSCNRSEKPEPSITCTNPACPVVSTCSDSPKANCRLILSANLCQYSVYRRTCCVTCQARGR